jgi:anaerobic dimethyl sulfoxide reductase subunit B (iron-sulfur subunit)
MQLGFYFDQTRCVGCFTCVVACKDWHDIPAGPANWMQVKCIEEGTFPHLFVAYLIRPCYHCEDPACLKNCPVGAISKSADNGIVTLDRDLCLGQKKCGICKTACPYGSPQFGDADEAAMEKCDFCRERWQEGETPICVDACLMRALDAGPLEELKKKYGEGITAAGFSPCPEIKPSIVMKEKKYIDPAPDGDVRP